MYKNIRSRVTIITVLCLCLCLLIVKNKARFIHRPHERDRDDESIYRLAYGDRFLLYTITWILRARDIARETEHEAGIGKSVTRGDNQPF